MASAFLFRIVIGSLLLVEYFIGLDGHGRGAGRPMTILFGAAFIAYGIYGLVARSAVQRKRIAASPHRTNP